MIVRESPEWRKKTRKFWKFKKFATWAMLVGTLIATTPSCNNDKWQDNDLSKYKTHVVQKWDTFWSLWQQSGKEMIFEEFLAEFIRLNKDHDWITDNGIDDDIIKAGETYFIPTKAKENNGEIEEKINDNKEKKEEEIKDNNDNNKNWWQETLSITKEWAKPGVVEYVVENKVEYIVLKWNKMSQINKQLDKFSADEDLQYISRSKLRNKSTKGYKSLKTEIDAWYDIYISLPLKTEPVNYNKAKRYFKSLEDITKPDSILSHKLNSYTFFIDPWHGNIDSWTLWYRSRGNDGKEKTAVYEAPAVMDISYRVAKLLRAHGAKVELTHYIPTRWILNQKDLPLNGRTFFDFDDDGKADEGYYDFYNGESKPKKPIGNKKLRGREKGGYATQLVKKYWGEKVGISFHADYANEDSYVYKFKVENHNRDGDWKYAKNIQKRLQWKDNFDNDGISSQSLYICRAFNSWWASSFLLELTPITNVSGAYILAEPSLRQKLAEQIVKAHLEAYWK